MRRLALPIILALILPTTTALGDLTILPGDFTLTGPAARQTLLVQETRGGKLFGQVPADDMTLMSSNDKVVKIENGAAVPVANGSAIVTATSNGKSTTAKVTVAAMDQSFDWSFRNHVQPVMAKFGCSSGACHGAAAGKNGFRLSLRGYDDEGDWRALTRQAWGRRITPSDPSASLLLRKPTGAVPHKGGVKIDPNSLEFRVLGEWIANGAPAPKQDDARIVRVRVIPDQVILKPGATQQIVVLADFTDGTTQDVTRWAKYTASDTSLATVDDPTGRVTVIGNGESAITAWYLSKIAIGRVVSPYANDLPADTFVKAPRRNFIDDFVNEKLASLNLPPSPPATDAEFMRRAFVDTVGVLPTPDEVRAFLADQSTDKRDKLIEPLLARPEFVDYWAYKWSDLLLVNGKNTPAPTMWSYYNWVRTQVARNTPWDQFARGVVTATGPTSENGAATFYTLHDDPAEMSEAVSLTFLGMSINCAKCHNHPMEKWTNDQYYGMANLFARVRTKTVSGTTGLVVFTASEGDLVQPLSGKPQPPRPLDGTALPMDWTGDRRHALADWLVSPSNPYFARSIVNRVWANFLGTGLVENIDDMRETNPPSNERLMAALASYLVEQKFDLKALMRQILQSQAYQRSSQPLPGNATDTRFYSRYYPRRLMAEVMLDGLSQVTGVPTKLGSYPLGWRAMQLPESDVESYFLKSFGRPERLLTCECERSKEPSMAQVLHIANGDTLNEKLKAKGNRIDQLIAKQTPDAAIVDEIYLAALGRMPTDGERRQIEEVLSATAFAEKRAALEDLFWGVLSSKEFLFNR